MTVRRLAIAALAFAAGTASAQMLSGASLDRGTIKAGEKVTLTAQLEVMSGTNCGLRVHWGDGAQQDFKINQAKDVPLVATHTYAKAGSYKVKVEPKTQGMTTMKCGGKNQEAALTVTAAAPAAKPKAKAPPLPPMAGSKGPAAKSEPGKKPSKAKDSGEEEFWKMLDE